MQKAVEQRSQSQRQHLENMTACSYASTVQMERGTAAHNLGLSPERKPRHPRCTSVCRTASTTVVGMSLHCTRVLTTSRGFVAMVAAKPARPPERARTPTCSAEHLARCASHCLLRSCVSHHTAELGPKYASVTPTPRHSPATPSLRRMCLATCTPVALIASAAVVATIKPAALGCGRRAAAFFTTAVVALAAAAVVASCAPCIP
mmetsp:Transcript_36881/g.86170  ORF Transcript_36881/g.86170 Transcript_36881/m.86170 type:complete len:205 (+) Transcript_36881:181-795(+)